MGKIRDKVRNLSVRKTILLYLIISLLISFLLSAYITWAAAKVQEQIWWKYTDEDTYFAAVIKPDKAQKRNYRCFSCF